MQQAAKASNRSKVSNERCSQLLVPKRELPGSLAPVLDIASARMRVMSRRISKDEVKFDLNTTVDPWPARAKVVWAKRVGFRQHEVGLNFLQPSPKLDTLIRCCSTVDGKVGLNPA